MLKKVEPYYKPYYSLEFTMMFLVAVTFFTGVYCDIPLLSVIMFGASQLLLAWSGHSMHHSRDPLLNSITKYFPQFIAGFSTNWWGPKHNNHHIFTNSMKYDGDIQQEYKVWHYPLMFLWWRLSSMIDAATALNYVPIYLKLEIIYPYVLQLPDTRVQPSLYSLVLDWRVDRRIVWRVPLVGQPRKRNQI